MDVERVAGPRRDACARSTPRPGLYWLYTVCRAFSGVRSVARAFDNGNVASVVVYVRVSGSVRFRSTHTGLSTWVPSLGSHHIIVGRAKPRSR